MFDFCRKFRVFTNDGYLVTHSLYNGCTDGADVELYRVDSADHEWLVAPPINDISYTAEIWKFFQKHTVNTTLNVQELEGNLKVKIFPNPSNGLINLKNTNGKSKVMVYDISGQLVFETKTTSKQKAINLNHLPNGSYIVNVINDTLISTKKLQIIH